MTRHNFHSLDDTGNILAYLLATLKSIGFVLYMIFCLLVSARVYIFTSRLQKLSENMQICLRGSVILLVAVKVDLIHNRIEVIF